MSAHANFERVAQCAAHLPGVEFSRSYGTPSLKGKGKSFVRIRERMDEALVVMAPLGLKAALIEAEPDKYFETQHYAGWAALLLRLDAVSKGGTENAPGMRLGGKGTRQAENGVWL